MEIVFNEKVYMKQTLIDLIGFGHKEVINNHSAVWLDNSQCDIKTPVAHKHDGVVYIFAGDKSKNTAEEITVVLLSKHIIKKAIKTNMPKQADYGFDYTQQSTRATFTRTVPANPVDNRVALTAKEKSLKALSILASTMNRAN